MFTRFEIEVLQTLWRERRALTKTEIDALTVDKTWKSSTINYVLKNLVEKKAIAIDGFQKSGSKHYARCYQAVITQEEYLASKFNEAAPTLNVTELVSALLSKREISRETAAEIRQMLYDYEMAGGSAKAVSQ